MPVRSAFFATTFAAAGLTALVVFSAGVTHLGSTPSMYGSRFDFKVETTQDTACNSQDNGVGSVSGVATLAAICYNNVELDGRAGVGFGDLPLRGTVGPEVVRGHAPGTEREVALGTATLAALHKHVGDTIAAQGPGGRATFRIVGVVVLPQLGDPQPVADGAWFTEAGFNTLLGPQGNPASQNFTRYLVGTYRPGTNRTAVDAHIQRLLFDPKAPQATPATGPSEPVEITRLRQTDWFPVALAALLAFLALAAISHTLVTGTRRRRRELAILKTLGFKQRQVRRAVASQATTLGHRRPPGRYPDRTPRRHHDLAIRRQRCRRHQQPDRPSFAAPCTDRVHSRRGQRRRVPPGARCIPRPANTRTQVRIAALRAAQAARSLATGPPPARP